MLSLENQINDQLQILDDHRQYSKQPKKRHRKEENCGRPSFDRVGCKINNNGVHHHKQGYCHHQNRHCFGETVSHSRKHNQRVHGQTSPITFFLMVQTICAFPCGSLFQNIGLQSAVCINSFSIRHRFIHRGNPIHNSSAEHSEALRCHPIAMVCAIIKDLIKQLGS